MDKIFIMLITVTLIVMILYAIKKHGNMSEEDMYDEYLRKIKKAFKKLLISISDVPDINKKALIKINHIDDLVDISLRIKKPIYYIEKNNRTCDFILIDNKEYNIYTLKVNEDLSSSFDEYIKELEKKKKKINLNMFEDLEKTTIIKIPNGDTFKISPLKKRKR